MCSGKLLEDAAKVHIPDFIKERLLRLDDMIAMVRDEGWHLPEEDRQRVLSALVYFCDPKDIIPDNVEVLGFLDDAVMIELCVRDLKHELDAYDDFCDYREHEAKRRGSTRPARPCRLAGIAPRRTRRPHAHPPRARLRHRLRQQQRLRLQAGVVHARLAPGRLQVRLIRPPAWLPATDPGPFRPGSASTR
jgi:uncharacterized membrane protein YkvA (DUF1232 family)